MCWIILSCKYLKWKKKNKKKSLNDLILLLFTSDKWKVQASFTSASKSHRIWAFLYHLQNTVSSGSVKSSSKSTPWKFSFALTFLNARIKQKHTHTCHIQLSWENRKINDDGLNDIMWCHTTSQLETNRVFMLGYRLIHSPSRLYRDEKYLQPQHFAEFKEGFIRNSFELVFAQIPAQKVKTTQGKIKNWATDKYQNKKMIASLSHTST